MSGPRYFFDAGMFIGALLRGDKRHLESRPLVEQAGRGQLMVCTSTGVLSEVCVQLTHQSATPSHTPSEAARAILRLIDPPSQITVLPDSGLTVAKRMLSLTELIGLRSRDVHDARHAATALEAGAIGIFTYNVSDWLRFEAHGLRIVGPPSVLRSLGRS